MVKFQVYFQHRKYRTDDGLGMRLGKKKNQEREFEDLHNLIDGDIF